MNDCITRVVESSAGDHTVPMYWAPYAKPNPQPRPAPSPHPAPADIPNGPIGLPPKPQPGKWIAIHSLRDQDRLDLFDTKERTYAESASSTYPKSNSSSKKFSLTHG